MLALIAFAPLNTVEGRFRCTFRAKLHVGITGLENLVQTHIIIGVFFLELFECELHKMGYLTLDVLGGNFYFVLKLFYGRRITFRT